MKSQKGVTLTSLGIYIVLVLIIVGILAVITANFQSNIKEIYAEGTNNAEIDKFNVYFLKEVKKQGNEIDTISDNEILFTTGNKYTFNNDNKWIYLNDNIKIAENIESCIFSNNLEDGKKVITVTIKAIDAEEKTIEYVLGNEVIGNNYNNESDYTNYIPEDWDTTKLNDDKPIYIEVIDNRIYIAPIPKGFEVSTKEGEGTISGGLVITDGANEFVWIPVANVSTYIEDSFIQLTDTDRVTNFVYDSQNELDYYYGTDYYNYSDFTYSVDQANVQRSIQTYVGFYVGRYETTYDNTDENGVPQGIGIKKGKNVLNASNILQSGTNTTSNEEYFYRWWGLYKAQKDMYESNQSVGSLMISSKQWDEIMTFTEYDDATRAGDTYKTRPELSGSEYTTDTSKYDVSKNIYDLAGNALEWTIKGIYNSTRVLRGGTYNNIGSTSSDSNNSSPVMFDSRYRF